MLVTPCHQWHVDHGGRMVDFAGWDMPVQYSTIIEEHQAVRRAAGLFDIAHMGRIYVRGPQADEFLDHLLTNNVLSLSEGQVRYSLITNPDGGILDDVLVYRLAAEMLLVVNASNRLKILNWIEQHRGGFDVEIEDATPSQFMLAIQGPAALEILAPLVSLDLSPMKYYTVAEAEVQGGTGLVSRTGYTGEDGFEIIVAAQHGLDLWQAIIAGGTDGGLLPAGLGCRDTLRLEAAMPLYGHELNEQIDPYTAGLGFAVKLQAGEFIGREALVGAKTNVRRQRIGLQIEGRRIAREGSQLFSADAQIGDVTSGTFSPTLQQSIAMAYADADHTSVGSSLEVEIRGKRVPAVVANLPFYRRDA